MLLVDATPGWAGASEPPAAISDVVAAYLLDPDTADPATSMGTMRAAHGRLRRFPVGVPGGHTLVLYAEEAGWTPKGAKADWRVALSLVDYRA